MTIEYIDQQEQLPDLCKRISQQTWIALDTEFLRERTYFPVFCLLQIATPEWVVCVDPIALDDLTELLEVINNPDITKVFHSCRQDVEIFYQLSGSVPSPIFDTQIAAPLLGFQENPGYAMLVSNFLNINLPKTYTRTDWSIRPLSQAQIQYAADDVIYLCKVYTILCERLEELGRLKWLDNDFKLLNNPDLYRTPPINAWLKIKAKNRLTGKQLSIVQSVTKWRETTAQSVNKPKNWLISDDLILELAKIQPETVTELEKIRGINDRLIKRYGKLICGLIEVAKNTPPILVKDKAKVMKKTPQQEAVIDVLAAVVRVRADENSINPKILASRKDLEKLLCGDDHPILTGWRYSMVGKELQELLQGNLLLTLNNESLVIKSSIE